jgi:gas vesicle protein
MSYGNGNHVLWFVAGLGLGMISGLLYAPRAGSQTRNGLRSKVHDGQEFVRARARQARAQAITWGDRGREVLNYRTEQFRSAYEAGKRAYQEAAVKV